MAASVNIRISLFLKELSLFALTIAVGIITVYRFGLMPSASKPAVLSGNFEAMDWVVALILSSLFLLVILRFSKVARYSFNFFLILLIFFGAQSVGSAFFGFPGNLIFALLVLSLYRLVNNVLVVNLSMIIAIAGISGVFGMSIGVSMAIILLALLSIYDIIAVYATHHMVALAEGMIRAGAVFGFIIPVRWRDFLIKKSEVVVGENFMILGSGDIGLPLVLVAALARISLPEAILVAGFSLLGLFLTHILFVTQGKRRPMAALPPIATMTIIGYLVTIAI